jgi:hypothetical protein
MEESWELIMGFMPSCISIDGIRPTVNFIHKKKRSRDIFLNFTADEPGQIIEKSTQKNFTTRLNHVMASKLIKTPNHVMVRGFVFRLLNVELFN